MTGENFKSLNRKNTGIEKLKEKLQDTRSAFTKYCKSSEDDESWNWNELHRLGAVVEKLDHELWCAEYEDNRRRNWR